MKLVLFQISILSILPRINEPCWFGHMNNECLLDLSEQISRCFDDSISRAWSLTSSPKQSY